jgi:hypothetical protein
MIGRWVRKIEDAVRLSKAFNAAGHGRYDDALRTLDSLGPDGNRLHDAKFLRGALYSLLGKHDLAVAELLSAAQQIKRSNRLSKAEANYLVAYAVQYWETSAEQIGLHAVTKETAESLWVDNPIEGNRIPRYLRQRFPLTVPFVGVDVIN